MKTRLPLLALCLLAYASQAQESKVQMWMWKDANGVVHYSDVPGPGAVRVDINVSKGQPGAAPPTASAGQGEGRGEGRAEGAPLTAATTYSSLEIVQPANETSFFDADSVVDVQIASDPALGAGDSVYLYLDGERVGSSGDAMGYSLPSVARGQHTLSAAIVDSGGTEKIRSPPVVFYMKQQTIYDSKGKVDTPGVVGPKLKPPPKPTPKGG
jgi:Domain of unknown function (DUF4124)